MGPGHIPKLGKHQTPFALFGNFSSFGDYLLYPQAVKLIKIGERVVATIRSKRRIGVITAPYCHNFKLAKLPSGLYSSNSIFVIFLWSFLSGHLLPAKLPVSGHSGSGRSRALL